MTGTVTTTAIPGNTSTTADEADVRFAVSVTDVRRKSDLADYTGQLQVVPSLRITDRYNGPGETGTVQDNTIGITVPCTATASTSVGSTCATTTTADAIAPGSVLESRRAIWQLGQMKVYDGGPDGVASSQDNTLFLVQGIYAP
jgi:hypothetical protein